MGARADLDLVMTPAPSTVTVVSVHRQCYCLMHAYSAKVRVCMFEYMRTFCKCGHALLTLRAVLYGE